jgi:xylulokinase
VLLLGIDVGTSSIKVSVVDSSTQICICSAQYPESERLIRSSEPGFAEQAPMQWWDDVKQAIRKVNTSGKFDPKDIGAIGIAYQMHGLVCVDHEQNILRDCIIWCDSRAVEIGKKAFREIGEEKCLSHLLNSPGNFTASKLRWVKENEPSLYSKIDKVMLPGDFISMKLTGETTTTISALSEGIFWDFAEKHLSADIFSYYGFDKTIIPPIDNVFGEHGRLLPEIAAELSLKPNIPVTYKAGDQPNNALSLNVLRPGEVAATAGTSGVIYGVTDLLIADRRSRVNTFAHVNHTNELNRLGVLLCINGTGILNRWIKNLSSDKSYKEMNTEAAKVTVGRDGLLLFPFGNGAERILENKMPGASINEINFNIHTPAHLYRAAQEGIAFAFRYGFDILKENGIDPSVIRAGSANMFLSEVFRDVFVNTIQVPVELYDNDGSVGAALGAGIGAGVFSDASEAFAGMKAIDIIEPRPTDAYEIAYSRWREKLENHIGLYTE